MLGSPNYNMDAREFDILFLGTGSSLSPALNVSLLVDNRFLFDAPGGIAYRLKSEGADLEDIDIVFVSHYFGDHIIGLPNLLSHYVERGRERDLYVVGPQNPAARIEPILDFCYRNEKDEILEYPAIKFEGLSESVATVQIGDTPIRAYELVHQNEPTYGYQLSIGDKEFSFTGNTGRCKNLDKLLETSDIVVVDMMFYECISDHLGVEFVQGIKDRFDLERVFGVHRSKEIYDEIPPLNTVELPRDGDQYRI